MPAIAENAAPALMISIDAEPIARTKRVFARRSDLKNIRLVPAEGRERSQYHIWAWAPNVGPSYVGWLDCKGGTWSYSADRRVRSKDISKVAARAWEAWTRDGEEAKVELRTLPDGWSVAPSDR